MTDIRPVLKNSPWKLTKHEFYTAYHYALQYNDWKSEHDALIGIKAMTYDGMPHGTGNSNPTETTAIKLADLGSRIMAIETIAKETDPDLYPWLLKGVTNETATYNYLRMVMHIPCSANTYYSRRRKFYYLLSKHIGTHGEQSDKASDAV